MFSPYAYNVCDWHEMLEHLGLEEFIKKNECELLSTDDKKKKGKILYYRLSSSLVLALIQGSKEHIKSWVLIDYEFYVNVIKGGISKGDNHVYTLGLNPKKGYYRVLVHGKGLKNYQLSNLVYCYYNKMNGIPDGYCIDHMTNCPNINCIKELALKTTTENNRGSKALIKDNNWKYQGILYILKELNYIQQSDAENRRYTLGHNIDACGNRWTLAKYTEVRKATIACMRLAQII